MREASRAVNLQKRNFRLFSSGILTPDATTSARQDATYEAWTAQSGTPVWQGDQGAASLAGVAVSHRADRESGRCSVGVCSGRGVGGE